MTPFVVDTYDLCRSRAVPRSLEFDARVAWGLELSRVQASSVDEPNIAVVATLSPVGGGILATGAAFFRSEHQCNRCLDMFGQEERVDFSAMFTPDSVAGDGAFPLGDTIDLEYPIRDEVLLAMPLVPLCAPDCVWQLVGDAESDLNGGRPEESKFREVDPAAAGESDSPFAVLRDLLDTED